MKLPENIIYQWPHMPPLPPPGQVVLIRVATTPARPVARQELRTVLRQVLAAWSGFLPEQLPLRETQRGPMWPEQLGGHSLDISLSYADGEAWIGLLRGGSIGIDAMTVAPIAEAEEVARYYLGPMVLANIQQSSHPARAFAAAWTSLEARLKCLKHELTEWSESQSATLENHITQSIFFGNDKVVTVSTQSGQGQCELCGQEQLSPELPRIRAGNPCGRPRGQTQRRELEGNQV